MEEDDDRAKSSRRHELNRKTESEPQTYWEEVQNTGSEHGTQNGEKTFHSRGLLVCLPNICENLAVDMANRAERDGRLLCGSGRQRWERQLRSLWRHECRSFKAAGSAGSHLCAQCSEGGAAELGDGALPLR